MHVWGCGGGGGGGGGGGIKHDLFSNFEIFEFFEISAS